MNIAISRTAKGYVIIAKDEFGEAYVLDTVATHAEALSLRAALLPQEPEPIEYDGGIDYED